jgi:hypothetical protein
MKHTIRKEDLQYISFDDKTSVLTIKWDTRGNEVAVCGLEFKVEIVNKIFSEYKHPRVKYNPNYDEAF